MLVKGAHRSLPINLRHTTRCWGLSSLDESMMNKDKVIFKIIGVRRLKYLLQIALRWMWLDFVHDLEEWLGAVKASYFLTQCWPNLYHHIAPLGQTIFLIKKRPRVTKIFSHRILISNTFRIERARLHVRRYGSFWRRQLWAVEKT